MRALSYVLVPFVFAVSTAFGTSVAAADAPFVEGPYVDRLTGDTATLHVRTSSTVAVTAELRTPGGVLARTSEPGLAHAIIVSALPPDTNITYTLGAPGYRDATGSFRTPPAPGTRAIDFVALGDCRDGIERHAAVIGSVRGDPDFLLHLGDMVPSGMSQDEWTEFFALAGPLLKRTTIVPVLGNHELIAPGGRELYFEAFAIPAASGRAYYVFDFGGVRVLVLDSNAPLDAGSNQHTFVIRELERARADGNLRALFVAVHHGPMSSGRHGGLLAFETSGLLDAMRRAGVDLVFSGHDHIYERGDSAGLKYVVTGGAGSPLYRPNAREPYQLAFVPAFHHVRVRVDDERIDLDVVRPTGESIERCHMRRGGQFDCRESTSVVAAQSPTIGQGPIEGISPNEDRWQRRGRPLAAIVMTLAMLALVFYAWKKMRKKDPP